MSYISVTYPKHVSMHVACLLDMKEITGIEMGMKAENTKINSLWLIVSHNEQVDAMSILGWQLQLFAPEVESKSKRAEGSSGWGLEEITFELRVWVLVWIDVGTSILSSQQRFFFTYWLQNKLFLNVQISHPQMRKALPYSVSLQ